jgi:hypothetical protein
MFEAVDGEDHLVIEAILTQPFLSLLRHLYDRRPGIGLGPDKVDDLSSYERGRQSLKLTILTDEPRAPLMPDDTIPQAIQQSLDNEGMFLGIIHRSAALDRYNGIGTGSNRDPCMRGIIVGGLLLVKSERRLRR